MGYFRRNSQHPFWYMFSIIQPLFLQKTKSLYPTPRYLFRIRIWIWIWASKNQGFSHRVSVVRDPGQHTVQFSRASQFCSSVSLRLLKACSQFWGLRLLPTYVVAMAKYIYVIPYYWKNWKSLSSKDFLFNTLNILFMTSIHQFTNPLIFYCIYCFSCIKSSNIFLNLEGASKYISQHY